MSERKDLPSSTSPRKTLPFDFLSIWLLWQRSRPRGGFNFSTKDRSIASLSCCIQGSVTRDLRSLGRSWYPQSHVCAELS
ncbi:hypothetical protein SCP_0501140 [Sparassis crispa]|uniref:Uncharacterized protein n=1 Tax=Sparassis crispa TaxID=139825 RepID=A0A401GLL2_9APHY|nr:hypothetical protein SCP_0501140 [Sparassis crispa]GBE83068.1 hypothetical protein SCP_0501140 [Sparassis crispa]